MPRKIETLSRLLMTVFVVAAAVGCESDKIGGTPNQIVGGVSPTFLFLDVRASRNAITANAEEHPIVITVEAKFADTGLPVSDGTVVNLTASLGGFDTPGGSNALGLELFNGLATANFYPGGAPGTARIRASLSGVIDQVLITIRPDPEAGPPPEPAPTASTISMSADTTTVSEEDSETEIAVEATVIDSEGNPFRNGPVQFSSPTGVFATSGTNASEVLSTDSNGQVFDFLTVFGPDLEAFVGSSFTITATVFLEGGGTATDTVVITILRAATATSVDLIIQPDSTVDDDGTPQSATLHATVLDNSSQPIAGVNVTFSTGLGTLTDTTVATDGAGVAETTLDLTAAQLASYCAATFNTTASIAGDSDNEFITISRVPLVASFTYVANSNTDVDFTDTTTGGPSSWAWDFNNDGTTDLTTQSPQTVDLSAYGFTAGDTKAVKLSVTRGTCTASTALQNVTTPP